MVESDNENTSMSGVEYRVPAPLDLDNLNVIYSQWKRFIASFRIFLAAAGLNKVADSRKAAILLNCIGQPAQELFSNTLKSKDGNESLEEIIEIFEEYFKPKTNEIINTFLFNKRIQEDGEHFDAFYTELRKIAQNCNFESFLDRMLRDRIIYGIKDRHVQQKLLAKKNLSLQQAVEICRTSELAEEQIKVITETPNTAREVDAVQLKKSSQQYQAKAKYKPHKNINDYTTYLCKKCNTRHGPKSCPAFGKTCSFCKRLNHYAVGCKSKNPVHFIQTEVDGMQSPEDL